MAAGTYQCPLTDSAWGAIGHPFARHRAQCKEWKRSSPAFQGLCSRAGPAVLPGPVRKDKRDGAEGRLQRQCSADREPATPGQSCPRLSRHAPQAAAPTSSHPWGCPLAPWPQSVYMLGLLTRGFLQNGPSVCPAHRAALPSAITGRGHSVGWGLQLPGVLTPG